MAMNVSTPTNGQSHSAQSNDSTIPDHISIALGCTRASSATPCNLHLKTQSTSSLIVHCENDANCSHTGNQYYWCNEHQSVCLQCVDREKDKEQQARTKSNTDKYRRLNYAAYKPVKSNSKTNLNGNNRKRKAQSENTKAESDAYEPPKKKMKSKQSMHLLNRSINDILQMISNQQNEIKQLKECNEQATNDIKRQKQYIKKLQTQLEQKEESNNILRGTVNELNVQIDDLNAKIKSMRQMFDYNKQAIIDQNKRSIMDLQQSFEKQIKDNEKIMKDKYDKLLEHYNNIKTQNDTLKMDEINLRDKNREYEQKLEHYQQVMSKNMILIGEKKELEKENNNLTDKNKEYEQELLNEKRQLMDALNKNDEYKNERFHLAYARDNFTYKEYTKALDGFLDGTS